MAEETLSRSFNFDTTKGINPVEQFNPTRRRGAYVDPAIGTSWYFFLTSPSCNMLAGNLYQHPYLRNMSADNVGRKLLNFLAYNVKDESGMSLNNEPFIPLVTNTALSFSPQDTSSQTTNYGETWTRIKNYFIGEDNDSKSGGSFSVEYEDYQFLPNFKLHKAWYEYIQAVRRGFITPNKKCYKLREIDYMASAYYFLLAPDGETILYWCRFTGVAPTAIPYSSFSSGDNGPIRFSINYNFVVKEDMEPMVLSDFNLVSSSKEISTFRKIKNTPPGEYAKYKPSSAGYLPNVMNPKGVFTELKELLFDTDLNATLNKVMAKPEQFTERMQHDITDEKNKSRFNKFEDEDETDLINNLDVNATRRTTEWAFWAKVLSEVKNNLYDTKNASYKTMEMGNYKAVVILDQIDKDSNVYKFASGYDYVPKLRFFASKDYYKEYCDYIENFNKYKFNKFGESIDETTIPVPEDSERIKNSQEIDKINREIYEKLNPTSQSGGDIENIETNIQPSLNSSLIFLR